MDRQWSVYGLIINSIGFVICSNTIYTFVDQVDKLEQSEAVRSEEEQKAEERPLVFGKLNYWSEGRSKFDYIGIYLSYSNWQNNSSHIVSNSLY